MKYQKWGLLGLCICIGLAFTPSALTQTSLEQDSTMNNLVHLPLYQTAKLGTLGEVKKWGHGQQALLVIAGFGFDWRIYKPLIKNFKKEFTIYAITIPGFGHTAAPPMPHGQSYADRHWSKGVVQGLLTLIDSEKLQKPIILSGLAQGTQIVLEFAIDFPHKIHSGIIIGGIPRASSPSLNVDNMSLAQRANFVDHYLAPKWFKTVTKKTWDSNMHQPEGYSLHKKNGLKARATSLSVPMPVMIQYLCEFWTTDFTQRLDEVGVPLLVLIPTFNENVRQQERTKYLNDYFINPWGKLPNLPLLSLINMDNTGAFTWWDQPDKTFGEVRSFIKKHQGFVYRPIEKTIPPPNLSSSLEEYAGKYGQGIIKEQNGKLYYVQTEGMSLALVQVKEDLYKLDLPPEAITPDGKSVPLIQFNRNEEEKIESISLLWTDGSQQGPIPKNK